jgi:hypothetical protein
MRVHVRRERLDPVLHCSSTLHPYRVQWLTASPSLALRGVAVLRKDLHCNDVPTRVGWLCMNGIHVTILSALVNLFPLFSCKGAACALRPSPQAQTLFVSSLY